MCINWKEYISLTARPTEAGVQDDENFYNIDPQFVRIIDEELVLQYIFSIYTYISMHQCSLPIASV